MIRTLDSDTETDEIDIKAMSAVELADYSIDLYEKILSERQKPLKRLLIRKYNQAATFYNENIAKFNCLKLC